MSVLDKIKSFHEVTSAPRKKAGDSALPGMGGKSAKKPAAGKAKAPAKTPPKKPATGKKPAASASGTPKAQLSALAKDYKAAKAESTRILKEAMKLAKDNDVKLPAIFLNDAAVASRKPRVPGVGGGLPGRKVTPKAPTKPLPKGVVKDETLKKMKFGELTTYMDKLRKLSAATSKKPNPYTSAINKATKEFNVRTRLRTKPKPKS